MRKWAQRVLAEHRQPALVHSKGPCAFAPWRVCAVWLATVPNGQLATRHSPLR